jgi:hypothetical protein
MYWWNVSKLAEDFREGRVEEKERFKYYLATIFAWGIVAEPLFWYGHRFNLVADVVTAVGGLAITIMGTVMCYRANKSGDNIDFIGRMLCLGWPIAIKIVVMFSALTLIIFALSDIVAWIMGSDFDMAKHVPDQDIIGKAWGALLTICIYWLLYKYITFVAHAKGAENPD